MSESFVAKHRVEFRDTDAAGIMHFSTFTTYMEESEHQLLRGVGLSVLHGEVDGVELSWPRVSVHCDFQKPLRFEDEFEVHVVVEQLGRKSVKYGFRFVFQDQVMATGSITAVCCVFDDGKLRSAEIPDTVRQKLNPFLKATDAE